MKQFTFILVLIFVNLSFLQAQNEEANQNETIIAPIKQLFDGMAKKDTIMIKAVFHTTASLSTTYTDKEGMSHYKQDKISDFITSIGSIPADKDLEERILSYDVKVDDNLAIVWTPYEFYFDGNFSHCGVNAFTLFQSEEGWLITSIVDTRRRKGCK